MANEQIPTQTMDASTQIQRLQEFFESHFHPQLLELIRKGKDRLIVDFDALAKFDPELATLLLEEPENTLKACEIAVEQLEGAQGFTVRFRALPPTQEIPVRNLRSKHLEKLIQLRGIVRQKSDVRPQVTSARFECPSCGNIISMLQLDTKFREPDRCGCGRKGKFRLLSKELVDAQKIVLEEAPDDLDGGEQPKRLNVFLRKDLVAPITDAKTNPGSKVALTGYLKEVPITLSTGGQSTRYDLMLESNHIEPVEEDYSQINLEPEEEQQIRDLANDPDVLGKLTRSLAPSVYGHDKIKEAIMLQLLGGVKKKRSDGNVTRGDLHVLLVGDPGSGKSSLLKRCQVVAPKSRFVSGKGTSAAGLCVSAGSIVLTNPGGMETIQQVVEPRITSDEEFRPGIWREEHISDVKIQSMNANLKIQGQHPAAVWKLESPEQLFQITTSSGKQVSLTADTQLFCIEEGRTSWKKASMIVPGDYVATPRYLIGGDQSEISLIDFVQSNPVLHDVEEHIAKVVLLLQEKFGTIRAAAKALNISENNLYHHWPNPDARGRVKLKDFISLCSEVSIPWKSSINKVSLYNGKNHLIPQFASKEFLYCFGLLLGDGDMRESSNAISIRLSSSQETLLGYFINMLHYEWGLSCDVQPGSASRPPAARVSSKILGEVLMGLGMPLSPKSHRISFSNHLLHLEDRLLAQVIAGLYDADGSVQVRTNGGNCVSFSTTSAQLAKQLPLVLLRFGIQSRTRVRPPAVNDKITGKRDRHVIEIRGQENLIAFAQNITLRHPDKARKLSSIIARDRAQSTNVDIIPGAGERLKVALQSQKVSLRKVGWHPNLSRVGLARILEKLDYLSIMIPEREAFDQLACSDIFWDRVCSTELIDSTNDFVYDLTVQDSHNFVVDGILVHNTASVVKDDFLKGWALEAGALVLANKGYCLTADTEIQTDEGTVKLDELTRRFTLGESINVISLDFDSLQTHSKPIANVSTRSASTNKIEFASGDSLTITDEHPVLCWDNGYFWKDAGDVEVGDIALSKRFLPQPTSYPLIVDLMPSNTFVDLDLKAYFSHVDLSQAAKQLNIPRHRVWDYNRCTIDDVQKLCGYAQVDFSKVKHDISIPGLPGFLSEDMGELLGLIGSDGNLSKQKGTISFYNSDPWLLDRFAQLAKSNFDVSPTLGISGKQVFFCHQNVHVLFQSLGVIKGNKSKAFMDFSVVRRMPSDFIRAFLSGWISGDGCVMDRNSGGLVSIVGGNVETMEELRRCARIIGAIGHVHSFTPLGGGLVSNPSGKLARLDITGVSNIQCLDSSRLLPRKADALKRCLQKRDLSAKFYKVEKLIRSLSSQIPHGEKKVLYQNGIKLSQLADMNVSWHALSQSTRELADMNPAKYTDEVKLFAKLIGEDMILNPVTAVSDSGFQTVYNLQVDMTENPNFFANNICVHNCMIDELDKMSADDRSAFHEALESQTVTISKANIQATLRCETVVLAAANPKFGRFDPYELLAKQIDLPPALINRFDLIFPVRDLPGLEKDEKLASFVLELHQSGDVAEVAIETDLLRKYLVYAKSTCFPKLSNEAVAAIKKFYVEMRNSTSEGSGGITAIPISARQLEALVRLTEASAKSRLAKVATQTDAERAIGLLMYCLEQLGMDPETGKLDIDRLTTGVSASSRNQVHTIKQIIKDLVELTGEALVPEEDILAKAEELGVEQAKAEEILEKLNRMGDVFRPKPGFYSMMK